MVKLKTLKDFPVFCNQMRIGIYENSISIKELKQEAIKWIKFIQGKEGINSDINIETLEDATKQASTMILKTEIDIVIRWMMHFFNITEEDLK